MELNEILVEEAKFCSGYIMANAMRVASGLPYALPFYACRWEGEETVSEGENHSPAAERAKQAFQLHDPWLHSHSPGVKGQLGD